MTISHENAIQREVYVTDAQALCEECLVLCQARIVIRGGIVLLRKRCPTHGSHESVIATDSGYYLRCRASLRSRRLPARATHPVVHGCPHDCGICEDHEQHICAGIIPLLDECDQDCPTCIAGSLRGAGNFRTVQEIRGMLDALISCNGTMDMVMFSGGEPALHPAVLESIDSALKLGVRHVMLITNGIKLASDPTFARAIAQRKPHVEIYLQFDSLEAEALVNIRGADLREVRRRALEHLAEAGVPATLVCVVKGGVNDAEIPALVAHGLTWPNVRGVTFQPIKPVGRVVGFDKAKNYVTLTDVRRLLIEGVPALSDASVVPHPCNPEGISIAYLLRSAGEPRAVTTELFGDALDPPRFANSEELADALYFTPGLNSDPYTYDTLFRVAVVNYLDQYDFTTAAARRSCIAIACPDGNIVPAETYFLLSGR